MLTDRRTDRQTDGQTDRQTDRRTDQSNSRVGYTQPAQKNILSYITCIFNKSVQDMCHIREGPRCITLASPLTSTPSHVYHIVDSKQYSSWILYAVFLTFLINPAISSWQLLSYYSKCLLDVRKCTEVASTIIHWRAEIIGCG